MAPKTTSWWVVGVMVISCWNLRPCSADFNTEQFFKNRTQGAIDFCNQIADDCSINALECGKNMPRCRDDYAKWTGIAKDAAYNVDNQCNESISDSQYKGDCLTDEPPPYCRGDNERIYTKETCAMVRGAECYNVYKVCSEARVQCDQISTSSPHREYGLRNCSNAMVLCAGELDACFHPQSDPCIYSDKNDDCSDNSKKCLYSHLCSKNIEYKTPPEYERSSCVWLNGTMSENETATEVQMRDQHISDYKNIPRSFDDIGNIMINPGQPLPFKFPVSFIENDARLELIVCDLPEKSQSKCEPRADDLRTLLSLKLEGNVEPCVIPVFEKGSNGVFGICRKALWDVRNGIGSAIMKVNVQGSSSNCKLTIKIKSPALEICRMKWNTIANSDNTDGSGDLMHKHIVAIGTARSLKETVEKKTERSDINQTTGADKNTVSHKKITEDKDTETSSHQVEASMGAKVEGGASYSSGGDNGAKLEGKRDVSVKDAYKKTWLNEQEKSTKHEDDKVVARGDSDTDKTSEDYSEMSRVTHAMTVTTTYTVETTVTIKPGSSINTEHLQLICSDLEHGTPYYRSYKGSNGWDPDNDIKLDWKNTTETKNAVPGFRNMPLFYGMICGIHALEAGILFYFELF